MREHGYIVELISQGLYVKAVAMDTRTLTEVSIVGDPARGEDELRRLAVQKLEYVLRRNHEATSTPSRNPPHNPGPHNPRPRNPRSARGSHWQPRSRR